MTFFEGIVNGEPDPIELLRAGDVAAVRVLIEAAQRAVDPAERARLFREMQALAATDLPNLPLIELHFFTVHAKTLRDVATGPDAAYSSLKHAWLEG